jgi:hypothetical protein
LQEHQLSLQILYLHRHPVDLLALILALREAGRREENDGK